MVVAVAIVDSLSLCVKLDCVQPMSVRYLSNTAISILASGFKTDPSPLLRHPLRRFQRFVPLGLQVPEVNLESLASLVENKDNLIAISKSFREQPSGPNDLLQGNVHPTRIILVALALGEPVPTTLNRFRNFAPVLGLTLPEGEPASWQFCTIED